MLLQVAGYWLPVLNGYKLQVAGFRLQVPVAAGTFYVLSIKDDNLF
jgi:hypothetical protein